MGRPRKNQADEQAAVRLNQAFWTLLETHSCGEVTVTLLAQTAGLNKNSFYYHYRGIEEFIGSALRAVFDPSIPFAMLSAMRGETLSLRVLVSDDHLADRLEYVMLYAHRCDTQAQRDTFKNCLLEVWLQASGRAWDDLSLDDRLTLQFVLSGLLDLLGDWDIGVSEGLVIAEKSTGGGGRPSGQALVHTLEGLLRSNLVRRIAGIVMPVLFPEEDRP